MLLALALALIDPSALSAADKAHIQSYVGDQLFDGESARWRFPLWPAGALHYCGWVNAKNRMGAYTGWRLYSVIAARDANRKLIVVGLRMTDDENSPVSKDIYRDCGREGYDISGPPPA